MKQGSTDDPFAEEPATAEDVDEPDDGRPTGGGSDRAESDEVESTDVKSAADAEPDDGDTDAAEPATDRRDSGGSADRAVDDPTPGTGSGGQGPARGESAGQRQSLPYIHARDGVKDGRTQRPVFLRDHVEAGIDDLVAEMEAELGEDVYKTDVTEAAMAVAQEQPDLVLAKLEEWGYGWT